MDYRQKIKFIKFEIKHAKKNNLIYLLAHLKKELKQAKKDLLIFN